MNEHQPYSSSFGDNPAPEAPAPVLPGFRPTGAEDETAMFLPEQPNDSSDYTPRRIPHLGHAVLFVVFAAGILILAQTLLLGFFTLHASQKAASSLQNPKLLVAAMAIAYIATLVTSWLFYPLLWHRSFAEGLQWNFAALRRNLLKLIGIGLVLGWTVQAISSLIPMPKSIPMDNFFHTTSDVWLVTVFGTLLAPLFEEICFRGFLLPAFAIAYDWLSLPRTPLARQQWQTTTTLSTAGLLFSSIVTSIFFALLHAQQLAHAWGALAVLFCVSLVLCFIRIRTRSVACSALVHACYNLSVFIVLFIATGGYRHLDKIGH
ncbi:MAG TPA: CPBP family intramembrane glutamic endopeptidase [Edaphobacter sp.]|nr:CPBP family intramembrane glutamic endopeptidase [Edaphobacter sp.]